MLTLLSCVQSKKGKKGAKQQEDETPTTLGPQLRENENNFGVAHIFASFNDTFVVRRHRSSADPAGLNVLSVGGRSM